MGLLHWIISFDLVQNGYSYTHSTHLCPTICLSVICRCQSNGSPPPRLTAISFRIAAPIHRTGRALFPFGSGYLRQTEGGPPENGCLVVCRPERDNYRYDVIFLFSSTGSEIHCTVGRRNERSESVHRNATSQSPNHTISLYHSRFDSIPYGRSSFLSVHPPGALPSLSSITI